MGCMSSTPAAAATSGATTAGSSSPTSSKPAASSAVPTVAVTTPKGSNPGPPPPPAVPAIYQQHYQQQAVQAQQQQVQHTAPIAPAPAAVQQQQQQAPAAATALPTTDTDTAPTAVAATPAPPPQTTAADTSEAAAPAGGGAAGAAASTDATPSKAGVYAVPEAALGDPLILDIGRWFIKAGVAGYAEPQLIMQAPGDMYEGEGAGATLSMPVVRAVIEKALSHFGLTAHATPLLLTERSAHKVAQLLAGIEPATQERARLAAMCFLELGCPKLYIGSQEMLGLFAGGAVSGLVVHCSHSGIGVVPVHEGGVVLAGVHSTGITGRALTRYTAALLAAAGSALTLEGDWAAVEQAKALLGRAAQDWDAVKDDEMSRNSTMCFPLTTGQTAALPLRDCCAIGEALLQPGTAAALAPELGGQQGVVDAVVAAVNKLGPDWAPVMYSKVVLCGGHALFAGLAERVQRELQARVGAEVTVAVEVCGDAKVAPWIGASTLCSLPAMEAMWVTAAEWHQAGPGIINQKC